MSLDLNRLIVTGENPFIRLSESDGGPITTNASFWRILLSPAGAGHVLYLKSELTQNRWKIYSDNIAMTRWLQKTVQGMLNEELLVDYPGLHRLPNGREGGLMRVVSPKTYSSSIRSPSTTTRRRLKASRIFLASFSFTASPPG